MKFQGKLFNWNDQRGFGFVEPNGGGDRAFVHISAFSSVSRRPVDGDIIIYEPVKDAKGKLKATNIMFARDKRAKSQTKAVKSLKKSAKPAKLLTLSFVALLCLLGLFEVIPTQILWLYVATSLLAFLLYAMDKAAARSNRWRTPESHLHLVALAGGWPGAFLAQEFLRHKSSKPSFRFVYWITVIINLLLFCALFSASGQKLLSDMFG